MAVTDVFGRARAERLGRVWTEREGVFGWLTTTDHKRIGIMYFFTTLVFFAAGGVEALLIRTQLIGPNQQLLSPQAYDEVFTMHGITMIFLFVIPMTTGAFGNYLLPFMIGARDMAFPRLNALSFWIFAFSGVFIYVGLALGEAPDAGWFNYVPLAGRQYSPGPGIDFYCLGLLFTGISTTAAAINFIVTIFKLRAPGMSLNRMPLFCYAFLAVSFALLFALPALNLALVLLELDRRVGTHFYDPAHGGESLLWQHLFWIFGHPEVYIIILPAFGIATSIIPTFCRRRMVAFPLVALAEILVAFLGFGVWVHHMFATGLPTVTTIYFAAVSLIITIPSAVQIFAWITTLVTGKPVFKTPLLYIVGFILWFILGGLSGIMFAAIPFDQQATDTYFVVAHFHFVIFGAAVFPILGGMHYWFPKLTGRMYHERAGQASLLADLPRHRADLLPDAHRRAARHAAAPVHLRRWARLDGIQPARDDRLLHPGRRAAGDRRQPGLEPLPGPGERGRPVRRRHARVVGAVAAPGLQLRGHPEDLEPVRQLGHRGPRGGRPAPGPGGGRVRGGSRDAVLDALPTGGSTRSSRCRRTRSGPRCWRWRSRSCSWRCSRGTG